MFDPLFSDMFDVNHDGMLDFNESVARDCFMYEMYKVTSVEEDEDDEDEDNDDFGW